MMIVTFILILINVVVYVLTLKGKLSLENLCASYYDVFVRNEYLRLLTSGFAHVDIRHLLCNMFSLYNVGRVIEYSYGKLAFLIVYLIIMVCGQALSLIMKHNNRNDYQRSVGASGAICGLLGIYFVKIFQAFGFIALTDLFPSLLPIVIISFLPGVDLYGHLFGFVMGGLISFIL